MTSLPTMRSILIGTVAVVTVASGQPALACLPASLPSQETGESDEAYRARIKAIGDEQQQYASLSDHDRAVVDQSRLWKEYSVIFLARVERVKVDGVIYSVDGQRTATQSRRAKVAQQPPVSPFESHTAFIRPIRWLKGKPGFTASWREVGGMTDCGGPVDGDLAFLEPGDEVIIFSEYDDGIRMDHGAMITSKQLSLYGVRRADAVAPALIAALSAKMETDKRGPSWDAAH